MESKQYNTNPYSKKVSPEKSISHKVGDSIERLGEKVIKAGAEKLGRAIYNAGDKIEHMNDDKNNPSKV